MVNYNLFELQEAGDAGWAHGRAYATGNATATAAYHRGIDLSAGIDVRGEVGGTIGKGIEASLSGGARLTAGVSFRAAYPLDLFSEAGLVGRLRAQAAAAYLRAELALDSGEFAELLKDQMPGAWGELAEIFLTEVRIGAGLWANAMMTVQFLAEAAIVGNFLEIGSSKPGFTASFQYAAGYVYGAGVSFRANFGLSNPPHLLDRMANQLVIILEREAQSNQPRLTDAEKAGVQVALPVLRVVLPLVFRLLYEEGKTLVGSSGDATAATSATLVQGFIREAQEAVAAQLLELALNKLKEMLASTEAGELLTHLTDDEADRARTILTSIRESLAQLSTNEDSAEDWLELVLVLLDGFSSISTLVISDVERDRWNDYLALAWAAIIIRHLVAWATDSTSSKKLFDLEAAVTAPTAPESTAHIVDRIHKPAGKNLTLGDAVRFVLLDGLDEASRLDSLKSAVPASEPIIEFLSTALQGGGNASLLETLFRQLAAADEIDYASLQRTIMATLTPVIEQTLLPKLFDPLEQHGDPTVVEILRQIIKPTALSVVRVILPEMGGINTAEGAQKLRELISAVLLQSLSRMLLISTDIIANYVATEGPPVMRNLAEVARTELARPEVDAALVLLSPMVGIPAEWTPTREDLADMFNICANALEYWNVNERADWLRLAGDLIRAGLVTGDAELDTLWRGIKNSGVQEPVPSLMPALEAFAKRLAQGLCHLIQYIGPDVWELFKHHFPRMIDDFVVKPLEAAAEGAIKAIEAAGQWFSTQIQQLAARVEQLAAEIGQALQQIAASLRALSDHLLTLIEDAVEQVRAVGWNLVYARLFDNDVFKALRNSWEEVIVNGVAAVYNSVFNSLRWMLDMPLQMFRDLANWVQDALRTQNQGGVLDPDAVLIHLRQRALAVTAMPINLPIAFDLVVWGANLGRIDLGTVLFPHQLIVSAMVNTLMKSAFLHDTVYTVVNTHNQIPAKANEMSLLRLNLQNALTQEDANNGLTNLRTGLPLTVTIDNLAEDETYTGSAIVQIVLRGANRTFVNNVLGVPPRVKILVNQREHYYDADNWQEQGDALIYAGKLIPSNTALVPVPVLPSVHYLQVELPDNVRLEATWTRRQPPRMIVLPPVQPAQPPPGSADPRPIDMSGFPAPGGPRPQVPPQLSHDPAQPGIPPSPSPIPSTFFSAFSATDDTGDALFVLADPLLGVQLAGTSADQPVTPVIVQHTALFATPPAARLRGVHWMPAGDLILEGVDVWRETIVANPGINRLDVVVVEGAGQPPVTASRTFVLVAGE